MLNITRTLMNFFVYLHRCAIEHHLNKMDAKVDKAWARELTCKNNLQYLTARAENAKHDALLAESVANKAWARAVKELQSMPGRVDNK